MYYIMGGLFMENENVYEIDMNKCCSMMSNPTCLLCLQQRYIPNEYDDLTFKYVLTEEIEN